MGTMMHQIQDGIRRHKTNVAKSRHMMNRMNPIPQEDTALCYNTARYLADSQYANEHSWKIEPSVFKPIGRAHSKQWDMRTNAKNNFHLDQFLQSQMNAVLGPEQYALARVYSTMYQTITILYGDHAYATTLPPNYFDVKGTYPGKESLPNKVDTGRNQKFYRTRLGETIGLFRPGENASLRSSSHYFSPEYCANIFVQTGLMPSQQEVLSLLDSMGLTKGYIKSGWSSITGQGLANDTLGRDLHTLYNVPYANGINQQALVVALIACNGSFSGQRGWVLLNRVLITGAWPWLGRYSKSYAKTIYTAMISLFSCVRHGTIEPDMGNIILALARKLVNSQAFGCEGVRLRIGDSFTGEKVLYEPVPKPKDETPDSNINIAPEIPTTTSIPTQWTLSPKTTSPSTSPPRKHPPNPFLIHGFPCNHGPSLRFTGRIHLTSSLTALTAAINTKQHNTIIVTRTFGYEDGVREVNGWLAQQRVLGVKRGEGQCVSCAVRVGHLVGAVVVVA